jgi:hypothetical protein
VLNGTEPGENGTPFFFATDGLNLLKEALVKQKFISHSENVILFILLSISTKKV